MIFTLVKMIITLLKMIQVSGFSIFAHVCQFLRKGWAFASSNEITKTLAIIVKSFVVTFPEFRLTLAKKTRVNPWNTNDREWLCAVDLLNKVACFVKNQ
jgi:hypothetical protein